jgi:hypothetical protein
VPAPILGGEDDSQRISGRQSKRIKTYSRRFIRNKENKMQERNMIPLAGLWKKSSSKGSPYYLGHLGYEANLLLFENKFKRDEKDPDLVLYIAKQTKRRDQDEGNAEYV